MADPLAEDPRATGVPEGGNWPGTSRTLPWALVGFITMLWLLPFDAASLPVKLPFDLRLDRIALFGLCMLSVVCMAARPDLRPRLRLSVVDVLVMGWIGVCILSVLLQVEMLVSLDEFDFALKKVILLAAFATLFYLVRAIVRPAELRHMSFLLVGLACVAALGTIWEYRTGTNVFFTWSDRLLPFLDIGQQPADPKYGRELISGPTSHAIALAAIFAMALPFAVLGLMRRDRSTTWRVLHGIAIFLILAGCFSTIRRTGAVAPIVGLLVVFLYRPRETLRLAPFGLVLLLVINFAVAPGAVIRIKAQLVTVNEQSSTEGRREDYAAVGPDIRDKPLMGRGHGSYDPVRYRFLDNEYLQRIVETGLIGLLAFVGMLVAMLMVAHRAARDPDPDRAAVGVAAVAGILAWATAASLFDILTFEQAPYMLFLVAGLAVVAARPRVRPG